MLKIWARIAKARTSPPQERSGTPRDRKRGGKAFLGTLARRSRDGVQSIRWRAPGERCRHGDEFGGDCVIRGRYAAEGATAGRRAVGYARLLRSVVQECVHHA